MALGQGELAVARRNPYGMRTEEEPKLNKHSVEGGVVVQGCACHDGAYGERSSGCWGFDAVMWNGWGGKEDHNSLFVWSPPQRHPILVSSADLHSAHTRHLRLRLCPHVCHPSRCLDCSHSLAPSQVLPFWVHIFSSGLFYHLHSVHNNVSYIK